MLCPLPSLKVILERFNPNMKAQKTPLKGIRPIMRGCTSHQPDMPDCCLTIADYSFSNAATNLHETLAIIGLLSLKGQLRKQLLQVYVAITIAVQLGKSCIHPALPIPVLLQLQPNSTKVSTDMLDRQGKARQGKARIGKEKKGKERLCHSAQG